MKTVIITEFMDENSLPILEKLEARGLEICYDKTLVNKPQLLEKMLSECVALIVRNKTQVTEARIQAAPNLKVVGRLGVGLDNIDLEACKKRHIEVIPATGANANAVVEYVLLSILALRRPVLHATQSILQGGWPREELMKNEIGSLSLGLVGLGGIAQLLAKKSQLLFAERLAFDPYLSQTASLWKDLSITPMATLRELLERSDVVSLHLPLTEQTHKLIGPEEFSYMKNTALLINTSRGGIVDEAALGEALRKGILGGASLDVFEKEPPSALDNFEKTPNLILTPHIAGVTQEANTRTSDMIATKIKDYLLHL